MEPGTERRGRVAERLAELVGGRAGARIVYGEPIERGDVTVVPVARVRYGFGGGSGRKSGPGEEGDGGGGGVVASPAGYLVLHGEDVIYRPIRDPARATGLALILTAGVWLGIRTYFVTRGWKPK